MGDLLSELIFYHGTPKSEPTRAVRAGHRVGGRGRLGDRNIGPGPDARPLPAFFAAGGAAGALRPPQRCLPELITPLIGKFFQETGHPP